MRSPEDHPTTCKCAICGNNIPFDFPSDLYQAFRRGDVVIFAGAGVSTEGRTVFPYTFYDEICRELKVDPKDALPFPDVMSKYSTRTNGRAKLLKKLKDRFTYVRSFPELYRASTSFHRELSTIHNVETIVTTNWDSYFEHECGATPFVSAEDFAFWQIPGRKVFKLHGSVESYGSIVATREDYEECYKRLSTGLLGSSLKMMLATKTVVYVGFSFTDEDFVRLHDILSAEMRGLRPQSYIVTLDRSSDSRFREKRLEPIYTDGTFFLSSLKQQLVSDEQMVADERFDGLEDFERKVRRTHHEVAEINLLKYPDAVYTLCYQDGLIHALERILALKKTGYYSHACNTAHAIRAYENEILPKKRRERRYHDVAYAEGYIDGHYFFIGDDEFRRQIPLYYAFGEQTLVRDLKHYMRVLKNAPRRSSTHHRFARSLVNRRATNAGMVIHHTPFL